MKTSLRQKLASLDNFGVSANLNIKGKEKVKTVFGAIVTLMCLSIIAAYSFYQLQLMFLYGNSSVSVVTETDFYGQGDLY
jgi:hypothetical protein